MMMVSAESSSSKCCDLHLGQQPGCDGDDDDVDGDDDDGDDDDGFSGEQQQQVVTVGKQEAVLYTWDNALGKRELVWTCGKKKDVKTDLTQVGHGIVGNLLHTCS